MKNLYIHPTALVKVPIRPLQGMVLSKENPINSDLMHGDNLYIGPYSIVGEGVILGDNVIIDAYCNIERGVIVGEDTLIVHRATIGGYSRIGKECVIGGLIGEGTIIGDGCRVFGTVVHKQDDPSQSWDHRKNPEPSVLIHEHSFVGFESFVAGDIEIGPKSYICAGAIVTKTVPPGFVAFGRNEMVYYRNWGGELGKSDFFKGV